VIRLTAIHFIRRRSSDLNGGPVTITLPDAGKRFMSMQIINEDHYVPEVRLRQRQFYPDKGKGRHAFMSRSQSGRWSDPLIQRISNKS